MAEFVTPKAIPYFGFGLAKHWCALTPKQRLYAHHMSHASWHGTAVVGDQRSLETMPTLRMFYSLFSTVSVEEILAVSGSGAMPTTGRSQENEDRSSSPGQDVIDYFSFLYADIGNYVGFGDTKFVPRCSKSDFTEVLALGSMQLEKEGSATAAAAQAIQEWLDAGFLDVIYDSTERTSTLGYHCTSYYLTQVQTQEANSSSSSYSCAAAAVSSRMTEEEITIINGWMIEQGMDHCNTRVRKNYTLNPPRFEILVASADVTAANAVNEATVAYKGLQIGVVHGEWAAYMARVCESLTLAEPQTREDTTTGTIDHQKEMIKHYKEHFKTGSVEAHKNSQRSWVQDLGPTVETNLGFTETYKDPAGVRGEWEGLVAIVNTEESKRYAELVAQAPSFIAQLPWGSDFEKDTFSSPDFTSLEVLAFVCGSKYVGINIPNYDDVKQEVGFKNVYLTNIVSAVKSGLKPNHVTEEDFTKYFNDPSFNLLAASISVGVHELLGHGTGKLFMADIDGKLNFDRTKVVNPLDGSSSLGYYQPGETWSSVFGGISNGMEECRAEAVALYLSLDSDLLSVFRVNSPADQDKMIALIWLKMLRAGLEGTLNFDPKKSKWNQAHSRARYCILQQLLRQPNSIVKLQEHPEHQGTEGSLSITLDYARIRIDGKKAIGDLLLHLGVYKSTADVIHGKPWFEDLTAVDDQFLRYRAIVLEHRRPRQCFVQPHTILNKAGTDAELIEYEPDTTGMVKSFVDRHSVIPL